MIRLRAVVRKRRCLSVILFGLWVSGGAGAASAQGKAPAPEFAVEMNFQSLMARLLADTCDSLSFDHAGFDRHFLALMGKYSDRGVHSRNISKNYGKIQPERYERYFAAFRAKYDLTEQSPDADYCVAGQAAAEWRTPVGRMLKVAASE